MWCICVVFNPAGYRSRIDNYLIFKERLESQKVNLLTVELAFHDQEHVLKDSIKLRSNSIMWQKERLINYAISLIPTDKFAWLDADLLLPDGWLDIVEEKLEKSDFVQLFQTIAHLKQHERHFGGERESTKNSIIWQKKTYGDHWLELRQQKKIYHTEPGFGWATKKSVFPALYDKLICGSGDNFLADCLLDCHGLHHYRTKFTNHMLKDMKEWSEKIQKKEIDYLPMEIFHLWHGSISDRGYFTRDLIFQQHDYNPKVDIRLENHVWEWATNKPLFHQAIIDYFRNRKEDG